MIKDLLELNKALAESEEPRPFYAATVVIDKDRGRILLGRRREDGFWTSPAGAANLGEHPKQAAIREAFEEAALQLKPRDLKELPSRVTRDGKVCHVFLAYVDSKKVKIHTGNDPDKEVSKWEWFSLKDPLPTKIDRNRLTSINDAKMKYYGLRKAIVSNPAAEIDLNTAEQSLDELAARGDSWVERIKELMADSVLGDLPRDLSLPNKKILSVTRVDDGIYSAYVKVNDPEDGNEGAVLTSLVKMTPEAMVQALKAKEYVPAGEAAPNNQVLKDYLELNEALKQKAEKELHIHFHGSEETDLQKLALILQLESLL